MTPARLVCTALLALVALAWSRGADQPAVLRDLDAIRAAGGREEIEQIIQSAEQ